METFDIVVIGAGPGGYPAAIRAAQLGASVAIVEKECMGGTCLNWGCIPTKTLIASSSLFRKLQHAKDLGISVGSSSFDYAAMARRKDDVVAKLNGGVEQLLKGNGVKIFKGAASFAGRKKITVDTGSEKISLEAKNVIIASGSVSAVPGFIPKHERIVESRKFLGLTALPRSLIVLGGGVIGCEFACMAAQLDVKVTIAEMLEDILFMLDADIRRELRKHMESNLGITILTGKPMENIKADAKSVSGAVDGKAISADMLLVSVGRKAYTDGLNLAGAGIELTKSGQIEIDKFCQTKIPGIFAIGDVTAGSTQLAHAATAQGVTAAENALGKKMKPVETIVPACIFTDPEIGSVGLTEQKAKEQGRAVITGKFSFAALGKAMASGETAGFVKWIADPVTSQLLGASCVGAHATELISEAAVAIRAELTVEELGRTIHCHPTMSESWMEAAHAVHGECIHAAPRRKKG
jgi:dihydrolipoamide dehydrogenase